MTTLSLVGGPNCSGCIQNPVGVKLVSYDGLGTNGVLLVGDSPWVDEVRLGRPFAGASGAMLDRIFRRCGTTRNQFLISNTMWCKPPVLGWTDYNKDAALAIAHCRPYLESLIDKFKPRVFVPLGNVAMSRIIGESGITERHAYVHDTRYGIYAVPTFHPSFILQGNKKLEQAMFFAVRRALEIAAQGGSYTRTPVSYLLDQPVDACRSYLLSGDGDVSRWITKDYRSDWHPLIPLLDVDIETPNSGHLDEEAREEEDDSYNIVRVGLSIAPNTAVTMPWQHPWIELIKWAVANAAVTVFHNGDGFDIPRLLFNGVTINGEVHDTMWMWHFLQSDMPKALGFVAPFFTDLAAWKHLSDVQPDLYNATDADAGMRCYHAIRAALESQGRWQRFVRHHIRITEILRQPTCCRIPVDKDRQQLFKAKLIEERDVAMARLQQEVPDAVIPRKAYKKQPKDLTGFEEVKVPCPKCKLPDVEVKL